MTEQLTVNQELYCQRRAAGYTQRKAYLQAYPRSQAWKEEVVDVRACELEKSSKVSVRLKGLLEEAAKHAVLTRTGLINRIADVNRISYDILNASEKAVDTNATSAFVRTSKHLLEYELVNDAETTDYAFVADYGLLLPPSYIDIHREIHAHTYTDYAFEGGRGSGKSSAVALEFPKILLRDPTYNGVVIRKVFNTLRKSVYPKLKWAIKALGLEDDFKFRLSPMEITYIPTNQKIYFLGLDDPEKLKSFECEQGYPALLWFEEYNQLSPDDVRSAKQSLTRGGSVFWRFYSWNPPRFKKSWVNEWAAEPMPDRIVHHSDYRMVPVAWLGEQFVSDAEDLREINETAYRHEYLGEAVGTDGEVFQNILAREITDEEIAGFKLIVNGEDWGYAVDPWVFVRVAYDRKTKTVYIFDEDKGLRLSDIETAERIKAKLTDEDGVYSPRLPSSIVYADSAEPKSVNAHAVLDINVYGAFKWPNSVSAGIRWLQSRAAIVIDDKRCPLALQEFSAYAYETDKDGGLIEAYPDKDNHTIDAVRYALSMIISDKKEV